MNDVGIVTLFGLYNFGNRLQNYAVQEIIKKHGFNPLTIISHETAPKERVRFWLKSIKYGTLKRSLKFRKFNKKYISTYTIPGHPLSFPRNLSQKFKFFVVGSDQVWNPDIRQNQRDNFFLSFAEKKQRIAISPSIAVPTIPDQWRNCYVEGLQGFSQISVRENDSVSLIKKLTGQDAIVLVDPTMILTIDQWTNLEKKISGIHRKYMLTMFLGNVSEQRNNKLKNFAKENELEIVDLNSKKWIGIGPDEFLYLIHNSQLVCTDSYHCLVFSILYGRPFVAFERCKDFLNDVNSRTGARIETLIRKFSSDAMVQNDDLEYTVNRFPEEMVKRVLDIERNRFEDFLNKQLR